MEKGFPLRRMKNYASLGICNTQRRFKVGVDKRILYRGQVLTHGEETQAVGSRVGRRGGGVGLIFIFVRILEFERVTRRLCTKFMHSLVSIYRQSFHVLQ